MLAERSNAYELESFATSEITETTPSCTRSALRDSLRGLRCEIVSNASGFSVWWEVQEVLVGLLFGGCGGSLWGVGPVVVLVLIDWRVVEWMGILFVGGGMDADMW
jgi:hypothetical protein